MKKYSYLLIGIVGAIILFTTWWITRQRISVSSKPFRETTNIGTLPSVSAKPLKHNSVSPSEADVSSNLTDIANKYKQGLINKGQAVQEILREENKKSLDLYGQVVDQYGQPVVGAKVRGSIGLNVSMVQSGGEYTFTETDSQGRFQFMGLHGVGIGIWPQKEGYIYDLKLPSSRPENYIPDPNNPLVFTMWKLRGAEPLKHVGFQSRVPYDGKTTDFNLLTGEKVTDKDSSFRVTLLRSPFQIDRGLLHPYDWQVKIEILNGGIVEEKDPYPYWAPDISYPSSFEMNVRSNDIPWHSEFRGGFYFKDSQGRFGRLSVDFSTSSKRPDTGITVDGWINPSGSQNLEFDPAKQLQ